MRAIKSRKSIQVPCRTAEMTPGGRPKATSAMMMPLIEGAPPAGKSQHRADRRLAGDHRRIARSPVRARCKNAELGLDRQVEADLLTQRGHGFRGRVVAEHVGGGSPGIARTRKKATVTIPTPSPPSAASDGDDSAAWLGLERDE